MYYHTRYQQYNLIWKKIMYVSNISLRYVWIYLNFIRNLYLLRIVWPVLVQFNVWSSASCGTFDRTKPKTKSSNIFFYTRITVYQYETYILASIDQCMCARSFLNARDFGMRARNATNAVHCKILIMSQQSYFMKLVC